MLNNEEFYKQLLELKNNYPDYPIRFLVDLELFVNSDGYQVEWLDYDYRGYNADCYQVSVEGFLTYSFDGKEVMKLQCETDKHYYVSYFSHLIKDKYPNYLDVEDDETINEMFEALPWKYSIVVWLN